MSNTQLIFSSRCFEILRLIHFIFFQLEVATIKGVQESLNQGLQFAAEEIRRLQKVKSDLERDLIDKEVAIDIDQQTSNLRITAPKKKSEMSFTRANGRYGPAQKNKQEFTPNDWKEYSERNIALSNKGIKSALHLQTAIDGLLARNTSNLRTQKVKMMNYMILNILNK